jgi:hypothetical protein
MTDQSQSAAVNFKMKSGEISRLVHSSPILHLRLPINPAEASSKDDKFTLTSSDGSYKKELTVKDDKVDGDAFVDLLFDNLKTTKAYTLEVDPGSEGGPYRLFEDIPYEELISYYSLPEPGDTLEPAPPDTEQSEDQQSEEDDGGGNRGGDAEQVPESSAWEADDDDQSEEINWEQETSESLRSRIDET